MDQTLFMAICFFLINSVRFIVFGLWNEFYSIMFNYIQFIAFNSNLSKTRMFGILEDIFTWMFFGLSPHPNSDNTINHIYDTFYSSDRRRLETDDKVDNTVDWFNENKFLLTTIVLLAMMCATFMCYLIYTILNIYYKKELCCNTTHNPDRVVMVRDGTVHNVNKNRWNASYQSFLIKIVLIAYCNLATITISQLLDLNSSSFEIGFLTIVVSLFIIGFPMYIYTVLNKNSDGLYRQEFMDKFGPLYLHFKSNPMNINFMVFILAKQLLYAISINLSSQMTYIQNSFFLIINIIFIWLLYVYKPFCESLYEIQAYAMCTSIIIISLLNYVILSVTDDKTLEYLDIINFIIHIISLATLLMIQVFVVVKEASRPSVYSHNIQNDGVRLTLNDGNEYDDNHVDEVYNPEYTKESSRRFATIVSETLTTV